MAIAGGDGSIILTTEVDTSGINKGTKNINNAISSSSKAMRALGNELNVALSKGDSKQAQLIISYQKAAKAVEEQAQKVEELKAQLQGLESGEIKVQDKGVAKLQSDLEKANATIEKTQNEIGQLYAQLDNLQMNAFKDPTTQEPFFTSSQQAEYDKISSKLDDLEPKLTSAKKEARALGTELKNAMNITPQQEIGNVSAELKKAQDRLTELGLKAEQAGDKLKDSMKKNIDPVGKVTNSIGKLGDRIFSLAKRVFVFSMITKALRSLRTFLGTALMSNEGFRNSLAQLQGQLWVAFSPIYSYILPALQSLVNFLTLAMSYVNQFISLLTGKSVASMAESGQQLKSQVDGYKELGTGSAGAAKGIKKAAKASKEATKEAKKQLAAFDDLQILTENKNEEPESGAGAGGAGGAGAAGGVDAQIQGITNAITATLLEIMGVAGGMLAAIGLILLFSGHPVIGIACIATGAMALGVSVKTLMEGNYTGQISAQLTEIMAIAGFFLVAIGLILLTFGQIVWGISCLIAGVGALAVTAIAASKGALSEDAKEMLLGIMLVAGGAMLALGIILLLVGVVNPLSIGLIVVGAASLAAAVAIDKNAVINMVKDFFTNNAGLIVGISLAILVIGIILCCFGVVTPLTIGMIVFGAAGLAAEVALNWNFIVDSITGFFRDNAGLIVGVSIALIIIGIILLFTGVGIPLAIGLIVAGGGALAAEVALNWNFIVDKLSEVWNAIVNFWNTYIAPIFTAQWWLALGKKAINGLAKGFQSGINAIITMFENMINWIVDKLNQLKIDIPDWVPGAGGKSFGFNLQHVKFNRVSLPALAQGAVIPPNREFLAVLGDQKKGTNIEAPADLIKQMAMEAIIEAGGTGQTTKEEHYYLNETELMSIVYKLVKGGERLKGNSLISGGAY